MKVEYDKGGLMSEEPKTETLEERLLRIKTNPTDGEVVSFMIFEVLKGIEKVRWSMSGIQLGCVPFMVLDSKCTDEQKISIPHNLQSNMETYQNGLLQAATSIGKMVGALEAAEVDLSLLKELMPKAQGADIIVDKVTGEMRPKDEEKPEKKVPEQ